MLKILLKMQPPDPRPMAMVRHRSRITAAAGSLRRTLLLLLLFCCGLGTSATAAATAAAAAAPAGRVAALAALGQMAGGAAAAAPPRSKAEMLQSLARKLTSARQPRHAAPDLPALRQQALGVLDAHAADVAERIAEKKGSFSRRTVAVHERVGATSALRESTRESVQQRNEARFSADEARLPAGAEPLNSTRHAPRGSARRPALDPVEILGRELLQVELGLT